MRGHGSVTIRPADAGCLSPHCHARRLPVATGVLRSGAVAADRRRRLGELGERIAREHLAASGLRLVDSNFRTRWGELDVVAASDRALIFCEVKTRVSQMPSGPFGPLASVGARKQRRVRMMARQWLAEHDRRADARPPELRFDAIGVTLDQAGRLVALEHLEGAF